MLDEQGRASLEHRKVNGFINIERQLPKKGLGDHDHFPGRPGGQPEQALTQDIAASLRCRLQELLVGQGLYDSLDRGTGQPCLSGDLRKAQAFRRFSKNSQDIRRPGDDLNGIAITVSVLNQRQLSYCPCRKNNRYAIHFDLRPRKIKTFPTLEANLAARDKRY
ncbi:hypothetical protein SmB9_24130 [Sphingosinicella microcystinivorans]|uniref:Uncharacterized protein n=1 Tax=Sphingosinicella microcystinivorans TaxID=335406 RepID=A0AAD1D736_SPHMI|nr:hypothetical protein SmB9_24130 [Sphingosinicella microcystinivorans]